MNFEYFLLAVLITIFLFLIAMWVNKTAKIFIWNHFATFSALISYLFFWNIITYIWEISWKSLSRFWKFANENEILIIIAIYFIFFLFFYKSTLFEVKIEWQIKKIISYIFLPFLTVLNLLFSMLLVINWPTILIYKNYEQLIKSFNLHTPILIEIFKFIPLVLFFLPLILLIAFLPFHFEKIFLYFWRVIKKKE
jgi:hypothetical protein